MTTLLATVLASDTFTSAATNHDAFLAIWNQADKTSFKETWKNGTGYLDGATDEDIGNGVVAAFIDDYDRKGILLSAKGQSVCVFERHRNGTTGVLVSNTPKGGVWQLFEPKTGSCSSLDLDAVKHVCQRVLDISEDKLLS